MNLLCIVYRGIYPQKRGSLGASCKIDNLPLYCLSVEGTILMNITVSGRQWNLNPISGEKEQSKKQYLLLQEGIKEMMYKGSVKIFLKNTQIHTRERYKTGKQHKLHFDKFGGLRFRSVPFYIYSECLINVRV